MPIPVVTIPAAVLASPFPTNADRTAGTFNSKSVAWANSENAMATSTREIAVAGRLNALTANQAADEANASAALATTNGAAQVTLATTQADLATTNGAAQVDLAAGQVTLATTQANSATASASTATTQAGIATTQAGDSSTSAAASETSRIAASKLNLGNKATPPTLDNQGEALLTGAIYYDTALNKWRVWTGSAWGDGISSISGVASVNGATGNVVLALLRNVTYDNRGSLRALSPAAGDAAVVEGLGLFVWQSASTEPDDDESCFATASGRWLLEAVSWDVVVSWQEPDRQMLEDDTLDFQAKFLHGFANCSITSIAMISSASFTGTVAGAAIGDRVVATPPDQLGDVATATASLSYYAWVSAANTVTILLNNVRGAAVNTNTLVRTNWPITVIKS